MAKRRNAERKPARQVIVEYDGQPVVERLTLAEALDDLCSAKRTFADLPNIFQEAQQDLKNTKTAVLNEMIYYVHYRIGDPVIRQYYYDFDIDQIMSGIHSPDVKIQKAEYQWLLPSEKSDQPSQPINKKLRLGSNPLFFVVSGHVEVHTPSKSIAEKAKSWTTIPLVHLGSGTTFGIFELPYLQQNKNEWNRFDSDVTAGWRTVCSHDGLIRAEARRALLPDGPFRLKEDNRDIGVILAESYKWFESKKYNGLSYRTTLAIIPYGLVERLLDCSLQFALAFCRSFQIFTAVRKKLSPILNIVTTPNTLRFKQYWPKLKTCLTEGYLPSLTSCTYFPELKNWWLLANEALKSTKIRSPILFFVPRMLSGIGKEDNFDHLSNLLPVLLTNDMLTNYALEEKLTDENVKRFGLTSLESFIVKNSNSTV